MAEYQKQFKIKTFKKDIFSKKKISFKKKTFINKKKVVNKLFRERVKISKIYELNIQSKNSKNFLLKIKNENFLLKFENLEKKKNKIDIKEIIVLRKLIGRKISLPINLINHKNSDLISLYKFIDGYHFNGEIKHFKRIIDLLPNLFLKKNKNLNLKTTNYFSKKENIIMENLESNKIIKRNFKKYHKKNQKILKFLSFEWLRLKNLCKNKIQKKKYFFHNDLHPHNILINKNGKIIFLDYRSFKLVNFEISLSYCLLKLCRQIISNKKKILIKKLSNETVSQIRKKFNFFKFSDVKISDLAKIEVLRRICIILTNIKNKKYHLNSILPILLNNFFEAEEIFKNQKYH